MQSLTAVGVSVISLIVAFFSGLSSARSAKASKESADAAKRQATAAEQTLEVYKQERDEAREAAKDARRLSQLSEFQLRVSMRPEVQFERRPQSLIDPKDFIVNKGKGTAINIVARFGSGRPFPALAQLPNTLAAGCDAQTYIDWSILQQDIIYLYFESETGDRFQTKVGIDQYWHPIHIQVPLSKT